MKKGLKRTNMTHDDAILPGWTPCFVEKRDLMKKD